MTSADQARLIATYRDGLLEDTLPFWMKHCVDDEHGGFMMALNRDGTVIDTDKGVWQQARFTWLLGELYNNVEPREEWLELARHGAEFIDRHCIDSDDGRMWFHVTRDGKPIRKRRYAFSESFAAIAYGELAKATGEAEYVAKAKRAFHGFLRHNLDAKNPTPKFTDTRPTRSIGFPMITIVTAQNFGSQSVSAMPRIGSTEVSMIFAGTMSKRRFSASWRLWVWMAVSSTTLMVERLTPATRSKGRGSS